MAFSDPGSDVTGNLCLNGITNEASKNKIFSRRPCPSLQPSASERSPHLPRLSLVRPACARRRGSPELRLATHAPIRALASAGGRRQGNAGLRRSCVACEARCGILLRLFGDVLQLVEQVFVRSPVAVNKQSFGIAALAPFPDPHRRNQSAARRCYVVLAVKRQGRARQFSITVLPVGFVVARHAADEEVEQERFLGVGGRHRARPVRQMEAKAFG
jgi:hypothetical protein